MAKETDNMGVSPQSEAQPVRRLRQSKRRGLSMTVNLVVGDVVSHVTLENVSATGMGLRDWSGLTCPRDVQVQLPDGRLLAALVCWAGKGRIGLKLVERLHQDDPLLQDHASVGGCSPKSVSYKFGQEFTKPGSRNILVAEALRSVGLVMKGVLEKAGNTVDLVENGLAVVEAARLKIYDLVLIDSQISLMPGDVAAARIRRMQSQSGQCAIIAVSSDPNDAETVGPAFDAHLVKPIRPAVLLDRVADTLARHELNSMNSLVGKVANAA